MHLATLTDDAKQVLALGDGEENKTTAFNERSRADQSKYFLCALCVASVYCRHRLVYTCTCEDICMTQCIQVYGTVNLYAYDKLRMMMSP